MDLPTNKIYLKRTGVLFTYKKDGKTFQGKRGELTVGALTLQTIERGDGYVALPEGEFLMTSYTDKTRGKVLGVQPDGRFGHNVPKKRDGVVVGIAGIMIHRADDPGDLEGCLAPGRNFNSTSNMLEKSSEAMDDIFTYLGSFGEGKLIGWIVVE